MCAWTVVEIRNYIQLWNLVLLRKATRQIGTILSGNKQKPDRVAGL